MRAYPREYTMDTCNTIMDNSQMGQKDFSGSQ